jgi:TolA-binding protein
MNISTEWLFVALMIWLSLITWRVVGIESRANQAPTHKDMDGLRQQIAQLIEKMARMEERTLSMQQQMSVIYEHVLKDES